MILITTIIFAEFLFLLYAASSNFVNKLHGYVISKMVFISIFAPVLLMIGGTTTNVGTLLYGSVMSAQCIVFIKFGKDVVHRILDTSLFILVMTFISSMFVQNLPLLVGNEQYLLAAKSLLNFSPMNILASFIAFSISQSVLIYLLSKLKNWNIFKIVGAIIIAQIVDSVIFFPIAFSSIPEWWMIMISGFWVKVALAIVYAPAIYLSIRK